MMTNTHNLHRFTPEFVHKFPEACDLEYGKLYVLDDLTAVVHKCPCSPSCKINVMVPTAEKVPPGGERIWEITAWDGYVSLYPSIQSFESKTNGSGLHPHACYTITNNEINWHK